MKPYSDYLPQLTRQIVCDLFAITLIALWIRLGMWIHEQISKQQEWGLRMEEAGAGFRTTMTDAGDSLGSVPFIGEAIRAPFDVASNAGAELEAAGQYQQEAFGNLAMIAGVSVALLPVLSVLVLWLYPRLRFARRAYRARALVNSGAGMDLFALRALMRRDPAALLAAHPDPAGAWRAQDAGAITDLARLELKLSGVKLPRHEAQPG